MIILAHHLVAGSEVVGRHGGRDWPGSSITSGTMDQGVQWDVPIAHSGGQQRPLYSPATWEPESSDKELDQTEYTQDPLAFPSRPLSQSTSEGTRLVQDLKVLQSHHHQLGNLVQITCEVNFGHGHQGESAFESSSKVEAASSSKGSSTPRSTAASSSKGSDFVGPAVASSSKGSAKSKSAEGSSSSKGPAYPRCIDVSFLQGVKCWQFDSQDNLVEQKLSTIPVVWHLIGTRSLIIIVHPDLRHFVLIGKQVNYFSRFLTCIIRLLTIVDNLTRYLFCPILRSAKRIWSSSSSPLG